jgi:AcrR family transcriptional regulator
MAEAAGIAEGTIFRVFPDKQSVIIEAIKVSMDPAPVCDALDRISESAPMDSQLEVAATILLERSVRVAALVGVLRSARMTPSTPPAHARRFVAASNAAILASLTDLFARHADALRVAPSRAAVAFRGFIFANAHPMVAPEEETTPREIIDLVLHGVADPDRETSL